MRGSKWDSIKPLLKILQESFPSCIHVALIIKPDNFWQKQRTNFGSSKFEFEVGKRPDSSPKMRPDIGASPRERGVIYSVEAAWSCCCCVLITTTLASLCNTLLLGQI